MTYLKL